MLIHSIHQNNTGEETGHLSTSRTSSFIKSTLNKTRSRRNFLQLIQGRVVSPTSDQSLSAQSLEKEGHGKFDHADPMQLPDMCRAVGKLRDTTRV